VVFLFLPAEPGGGVGTSRIINREGGVIYRQLLKNVNSACDSLNLRMVAESIYSNYPPRLDAAQEQFLVATIKNWTIQNGLTVRPPASFVPQEAISKGVLATNAPVTLFPSPFPQVSFEEARAVQKIYNKLYADITRDEKWLGEIIQE